MSSTRSTSAHAMGPAPTRRRRVHHVGAGHAVIHVDHRQRAARATAATHPALREQAITDAYLERYAYHEVDPVAWHVEDPVDRLRREEPDAIDLAAAVDYARVPGQLAGRACVLA
jgi:hypothetical protein